MFKYESPMSQSPQKFQLNSHAKVNLSLEITGKLPNGYHTLQSVMAPLELHDEMTFTFSELQANNHPQKCPKLQCQMVWDNPSLGSDPQLPTTQENICQKTLARFFDHPWIQKNIPHLATQKQA